MFTDQELMNMAIREARIGIAEGGIPIGAVLASQDRVLGVGHNRRIQQGSSILHGETDALEAAGRLPASTYSQSTMATTLSPCHLCAGAVLLYGIPRVVIGENRTFLGAEELLRDYGVEVVVIDSDECVEMMSNFVSENPAIWKEDIGEPT